MLSLARRAFLHKLPQRMMMATSEPQNVAQKLLNSHIVKGEPKTGSDVAIRIDQTLTQDATGTMVMLHLEAMGLSRVRTELSAQYVDHNIVQTDFKNPDDHLFLLSSCSKYGIWYSRPGNGVSHPVHMERFGKPGKSLLGSDSHTCAGGSLGMLAIGAGGFEVAAAIAGEPFHLTYPKIMGVRLTGSLPPWVSAKDVILEMLRRHTVSGGVGKIIEYYGPGLQSLSAMDRHVIANMGAELGASTTVFPADDAVRKFLRSQEREKDFQEIVADEGAKYDEHDEIDLSKLVPLIALPSSPDKVVPVKEVAGKEIFQSYIGSSANPGYRDFAVPAMIVKDKVIPVHVSFDINPTSRQILQQLTKASNLASLIASGARIHQAGCNGCIGMGQAPATGRISLRTVPRNFPGRSGTKEDAVYLCSPETAAASALKGKITDPRDLEFEYPKFVEPETVEVLSDMLLSPQTAENASQVKVIKGPNIKALPEFSPMKEKFKGVVALKLGDNVSTDEILPAGTKVLPFRSNIFEISKFTFGQPDETFYDRAMKRNRSPCVVVGGKNYGQGSSREHAAIAPRYLGVEAVIAKSFARIHRQNLLNFGVLPLYFVEEKDYDSIEKDDEIVIDGWRDKLKTGEKELTVENKTRSKKFQVIHRMNQREIEMALAGGYINTIKKKIASHNK